MADTNELYEELAGCSVGGVVAKKYRSLRTGIVVCIAQVEGPLVDGYFCLATEAHDDDGLPHTLEHLVFMGSEEYPYKGVLDLLANRCLAQGTNAWTDVDHTCYTVTTAGSEGFLNLLPIYLEHILYPTLTDAAYITEVHHINGEGDDAGVVYCEMQARENTSEDLTHYHMLQAMYPGNSGYKSETGGRLSNLRTSTSNEKVRSYHASYYRPDNLCLIVTGQVSPEEIFKAMSPLEEKILKKGPLPPMTRPWQSPIDPLVASKVQEVPFPTSEEDDGMVRVAWRGPKATDRLGIASVEILMEYLTDTPVAPLQRDLVEIDDPYCCDVEQLELENQISVFGFTLQGVPTDKLAGVEDKVVEILSGLSEGREEIDMTRMGNVISQRIIKLLNQVEQGPSYFFAFCLIGDFLFGDTPNDFELYLDSIPRLQSLLTESSDFWTKLIKQYFVDVPHITILGRPSADLAKSMADNEKERVEKQQGELEESGLKKKAEELKEAIEQNEIPAPEHIISSLPVPGIESISFHPITVLANHTGNGSNNADSEEYKKFPVERLPIFTQVNHIHSNFIKLIAVLDTSLLEPKARAFLPLYSEILFESPLLRDGEVIPYESVVAELQANTLEHGATIGFSGSRFKAGQFPDTLVVGLKVEMCKYEKGVQLLYDVLYRLQFSPDRLSIVANKMINDVNRLKREGNQVARMLMGWITMTQESNSNLGNMVTQLKFLTSLQEKLKDESTTESVIEELKGVAKFITDPTHLHIFVSTDVNKLPGDEPWKLLEKFPSLPTDTPPSSMTPIPFSQQYYSSTAPGRTVVAGVGGVESNYLLVSAPCVKGYSDPDLPAIMLFAEYLSTLEGPMWRQIRGMGLSYHYSLRCSPIDGLLSFALFKSSQLMQAYEVAKKIVMDYITGETKFQEIQVESAKSCVIYEIISREATVPSVADQATMRHFRKVPLDYNRKFLQALSTVSIADIQRVGKKYFERLFDCAVASCSVCCNTSKVEEIKDGLTNCGHKVEIVSNIDDLAINLS